MKAHVGIDCSNLEMSVDFFRECGLSVAFQDKEKRSACLENEIFEVSLFENNQEMKTWKIMSLRHFHIGFQVPTHKSLIEIHQKLSQKYETRDLDTRDDGDIYFFVKGPDDIRVEFYFGDHLQKRNQNKIIAKSSVNLLLQKELRNHYAWIDESAGLVRSEKTPEDLVSPSKQAIALHKISELKDLYDSLEKRVGDIAISNEAQFEPKFRDQGSVLISKLIPDDILAALSEYYEKCVEVGFWQFGDVQCSTRYWVNNEPLARRLQHVLAPQVSQICSQKIKPTFSTSMRYEASSDLSPHRDREQAWLTMTLQLSKKKKDAWSFCVESRNQSNQNQSYLMQNGDAVLFEGETLQHWRERMPANDSCLMMCMHFAKETYNGFYR